jgi:hypothetical protein
MQQAAWSDGGSDLYQQSSIENWIGSGSRSDFRKELELECDAKITGSVRRLPTRPVPHRALFVETTISYSVAVVC